MYYDTKNIVTNRLLKLKEIEYIITKAIKYHHLYETTTNALFLAKEKIVALEKEINNEN